MKYQRECVVIRHIESVYIYTLTLLCLCIHIHIYIYIYVYLYIYIYTNDAEAWYRVAKTHRIP